MANHKSAVKEHRQSLQRRLNNRGHRSTLRSQIKRYRQALDSGDTEAARGMLSETLSMVDRSARHGAIENDIEYESYERAVWDFPADKVEAQSKFKVLHRLLTGGDVLGNQGPGISSARDPFL